NSSAFPALKRWAKLGRPSGAEFPVSHSLDLPTSGASVRAYFLLPSGCLPSNVSLSSIGLGLTGPPGLCAVGATRCAVHKTINSPLLFWVLVLLKKLPRIGISPSQGTLL